MIIDPTQLDINEQWRLYKEQGDFQARDRSSRLLTSGQSGWPDEQQHPPLRRGLVSYGLLGLIGAGTDPREISSSETYAVSRIKGSITMS